ncbi:LrgB family protein [Moritella viscosa]|uniref:Seritonin transporter n=1 Tax=Moritella viscosa TaxID=80854 RepID=A0A090K924_9GAMM|nr:LrgB family protein [Moritella viscosa]CED60323.1 putative effector of murein hydrolase, LrgB family [Moritella viscosa]SGY98192.1 Putative seritonin transporter [Moritella viscosa]SGZ05034.1 Putative seritonin transporter [Moritella viscosa]SGZ05299.1 Putative seritonin transporter [Moritella viscosa]SGZ12002.1 Putative seritonin transporter [Moritella viscosa]
MIVYLAIPITLVIYFLAQWVYKKTTLALFNPILLCIGMLITIMIVFGFNLEEYEQGTTILTRLLEPAVIALAFPLYQQFIHVKAKIVPVLIACSVGVIVGLVVTTFVAISFSASPEIVASLAPKAVTSPIAMAISETIGGIPAISAIMVIMVGIFGNVCAPFLLKHLRIRTPEAQGLAIGAGSHVIGTSKAMELSRTHGAFSTTALLISGVLTSIIAPVLYPYLLIWML